MMKAESRKQKSGTGSTTIFGHREAFGVRELAPAFESRGMRLAPKAGRHLKASGSQPSGFGFRISRAGTQGFTMVEIALSLAVIGFALVAIIGVLPTGMNVQRDNREETIIDQDETVFMNAIRNGQQGLDDLTNYFVAITNNVQEVHTLRGVAHQIHNYTYTYTWTNASPDSQMQLTNGAYIIGLLSTPKIVPFAFGADVGYYSNHISAVLRSLSGPASDKAPQTNSSMQDLAFSYRLISEVVPFCQYNTNWIWTNQPGISGLEYANRSNYLAYLKQLTNNLTDVRLTFRWPVYPGGSIGNNRQVFRAPANGSMAWMLVTNPPIPFTLPTATAEQPNRLWFSQPSLFVKGP